jgi:hypothetical protein
MSIKSLKEISSSVVEFSKDMLQMPTRVAIWHSNVLKEDGNFNEIVNGITDQDYDDVFNSLVNESAFGELTIDSNRYDKAAEYISHKVKESHLFISAGAASFALIGEQLATGRITEASAISLIAICSFSLVTSMNVEGMIAKVSEEKKLKFPSVEDINSQFLYGKDNMSKAHGAGALGFSSNLKENHFLGRGNVDISNLAKNRFEEINAKNIKMKDTQQEVNVSPSF